MRSLLLSCWLLLATAPALAQPAAPPAVPKLLAEAAAAAAKFQDSEALGRYQAVLDIQPANELALCQAAALSVQIGQRYSDETRKQAYFGAARRYAARALALRPEGGEANYAAALALFAEATLRRARGRLAAFRELRSHVYLAAEKCPEMPEAWQLLGRWQYRVAHYNPLERLASRVFFGAAPAAASQQAMTSLERARDLAPNRLQYRYDLARMYHYQGRRRRAIAELEAAAKLLPATSEELIVSRLCAQLLPPLLRADARRQRRPEQRPGPRLREVPGPLEGTGKPDARPGP